MIRIDQLQVAGKLAEITLAVDPGEVVVVVGSRGSGKTTLIRTLVGLHPIAAGSAAIAGLLVSDARDQAKIGVVGEAWGFMERLTVWENMSTYAGFYGVPERRVLELLKRLDLLAQMRTRVQRLQAGELARLRLDRALLHEPPVLLLDEPAGDIDGESASMITFTVAEEAEAGKAVLVTTFGYPRTLEMATRVCYLEERLAEYGFFRCHLDP